MTEKVQSFRREAYRLFQAAKHARDEDMRAALMALAKQYLERALAEQSLEQVDRRPERWWDIGSVFRT